jgi:hypothetical protein
VSAIAAKKKRPIASCCQSGTHTVRLGRHVQPEYPIGSPRSYWLGKKWSINAAAWVQLGLAVF